MRISFMLFPRLIPAHAGSTCFRAPVGHGHRAHPRSRGEHALATFGDLRKRGSSPLTRGARLNKFIK